jgi:hypothetical protein
MITKKVILKSSPVLATVLYTPSDWSDARLSYQYKGVYMTAKQYDIKIMLEKRAAAALQDCHHGLKAVKGKVSCNNDFISLFASNRIGENTYKNSLTVQIIDAKTSVLWQTGLHFILAIKIADKIFVNRFPFGNRTVSEQIRFDKLKIKTISFRDGTIKASHLEKLLFACQSKEEAEKVNFEYPKPNIKKGIKTYLANCIAMANK